MAGSFETFFNNPEDPINEAPPIIGVDPTPAPGTPPTGFFSDPSLKFLEDLIRQRLTQVQTPLPSSLPGMQDFQSLLGSFSGSSGGGSGSYGGADPLTAFRSFVAGFDPNAASGLETYAAGRDPNAATQGLQNYTAGRDPNAPVTSLQQALAALGPNQSLPMLQAYLANRDPNAPAQGLQNFLQGFNPLGNYGSQVSSRVEDLRGDPFDDTVLRARRVAAFEDIERERQTEKDMALERLASRGMDASSGVLDSAHQDIDARYDARRAAAQNMLVQEEFQMREQRNAQADQLEATAAGLRLQSGQIAASLSSQIALLQQQGVSMSDAINTSLASLGLQDRAMQQSVSAMVAQLQQQGLQMQDALQVALTTAGLQAQQQADQLRVQVAQTGLQESGMEAEVQSNLAGLGTQIAGQDKSLAGMLAQSNASSQSSSLSALMQYLGLQQNQTQYNDERSGTAVQLGALIDQLVRQGLLDVGGQMPQLR